jgi:SAM-dependent methyltransferase
VEEKSAEHIDHPKQISGINQMKEAQCPICTTQHALSFFLQENAIVAQQFVMPTREDAQRCERGKIELALCMNCGTIWNVAFDPRFLEYSARYEATQMSSPTFRKYAAHIARYLIQKYALRGKNIIEIGAGNGYFLGLLCQLGNNRGIGFEPGWKTETGMDLADAVKIIPDYYSDRYAEYQADLICCRHVLEHVQDPIAFLKDIKRVSAPSRPVFFFEVPNVTWSLRKLAFWDIYYEHSFYFSRPSLNYLFAACRLSAREIREGFGGQYVWIESQRRPEKRMRRRAPRVPRDINKVARAAKFFSANNRRMIDRMWRQVNALTHNEKTVLWGAGAKGVAFLNHLDIPLHLIEFVVDINPKKYGTYIPGTGQSIVPPQFLLEHKPDNILVMNPQYLSEIRTMLKELGVQARLHAVETKT